MNLKNRLNNSVCGETIEDVREHTYIKLLTTVRRGKYLENQTIIQQNDSQKT